MNKKTIRALSVLLALITAVSSFAVTAYALSWDGSSAGGGGAGTSAGPNGYAIMTTDDNCMVGYRFSVVDKNGSTKNGKVIDVYRNTSYANQAFNWYKFTTKCNKKQLKDNQNGGFSTSKTTANCYKEADMGFAQSLPVTSGMSSWQNDTRNLNPILSKLGIGGIFNLKNGDKILVEPIFDVRLESVWHSLTVTEIALYGKHILGANSNGGASKTSESWGFISEYTNRHFPNSLYTPDGQGLWTGVGTLSKRATFYTIINDGYGVGIAYTETKPDFTPNLSVYCCEAWPGDVGVRNKNHYGISYGSSFANWTYGNGYPKTDSSVWYAVHFPAESENCYVKQSVWVVGGGSATRNVWSNSNTWYDVKLNTTTVGNSTSYITVKARADWIESNGTVKKYGVEKTFYIPIKPIVTRDSVTAYGVDGAVQATAGASGTSGAMYFGQKVTFKYKYGGTNAWVSSNHLRGQSYRWNGSAWELIYKSGAGEDVYVDNAQLGNSKTYTANSSVGSYIIPLNSNEDANSYKMRFRFRTYWASDISHTEEETNYYLPILKSDVELYEIKLVNDDGEYVNPQKLEVADSITVRYVYKNNTDCTVYVKGYKNDGTQIPGTFAIPAGETIEVDGYTFTVPNKRTFYVWGGVYLDTVARGNTEYETNGNNNAWLLVCRSNHPVKITPITPNAPYREKTRVISSFYIKNQSYDDYLQLYPSANILVASKKDFETKNRKKFCGRIATGDYDAIIIGHSQFEKIPMSIERQQAILNQQLEEIMNGIAELKRNRGENFSIKQLEKSKKTVKQKLEKLNDQTRKDDVVTFEELGVDRLFIDEAHYYKNLAAFTKMRNVGGISQTEAQKSSDLYMKCRYLDELTGGKGVVFATGTPISNSMVELYTMQKYLQYNLLKRNNLIHFDSWASTFGETVTAIELAPEGSGYRAKTRFAKFYNLPELMSLFKETADIQTADMLKLPVPKANYHNVVLKPSEQQKKMVASLSERAEKVRNKMVDSSVDNMLLITNDGRKLALDQRMINEMLPDSETSKVSACANNVFDIWQRTADERSTQMVFCDLSTPHGDGSFNVYDDLRDKLIAKGVPGEEIAYIHSANTEMQKKELFGKVRSGQVRVLIGSTQKMGAGTNVQKKLIALHHLDCPWRPSDLQQREGRIIRQGNENPEVEIYTYVTENTFDSYLYQLVESKQKFIGQIMTSKSPVRSAEDVDEQALSYAEIKALCTGNPYIKEKMDLDIDVSRLKLLKANHLSQIYSLEDKIHKEFPQKIAALEERIKGYDKDIATAESHPVGDKDNFCGMTVKGVSYADKKEAGEALIAACKSMTKPDAVPLGSYRGFDTELSFDTFSKEYKVVLIGELRHTVVLGTDIFGNILRLDNALGAMPERQIACKEQLEDTKVQLENAKVESQKPFPHEEELKTKSARLAELNTLLDMDKKDNEIVDGERSEESEEPDRSDSRDAR